MFGRKKRAIAELEERIKSLEQQLESVSSENKRLKDRMIDVDRRERGIGRALNEATSTADNMIAEAQKKADALLAQAQDDCDAKRGEADRAVDDAYRNAREIVRQAEDESTQKREEMQDQIRQYAALLNDYDAMVQAQLKTARDSANRFAELSRALHDAVPMLLGKDGAPLPGLGVNEPEQEQSKEPSYFGDGMPDYQTDPLHVEPSRESGSGDDQLWTVDKITSAGQNESDSDVDAIIDEILAAAEDDA